jgi:ubiquinone/menaquinone biosynthesis C-methylase UbiE
MVAGEREALEEGPILDETFIEHYWRVARRPARWAGWWLTMKVRKLGVSPSARVLDVGCGPAWLSRHLRERFPRMHVVALDASEPMIRQARRAPTGATGPSTVRFVVGDGCRLPFADGHFDLVISGATLHHIANPVGLLDEIDRVLADGGHVLVSDLDREVPRVFWPLVRLADWLERRMRPAGARDLNEGIAASFRAAYTGEEMRRCLAQSTLGRRVRFYSRIFEYWIQTPPSQQNARAGLESERMGEVRGDE